MDDRVPSISRTPRSTESTHGSPKGARPRRPSKEDLLPKSGEVRLRIASSGPRTLTLTITLSLTLTLTLALTLALTLTPAQAPSKEPGVNCRSSSSRSFLAPWAPMLTHTSWGLRTVRTCYACQPPACRTYRRRRAACPKASRTVQGRTRTSLGRAVRTAYRGTTGGRQGGGVRRRRTGSGARGAATPR